MQNVFTVDVEDWFHFSCPSFSFSPSEWDRLESRVEARTSELLSCLEEHEVHATFFVLGWVAERFPMLLKEIAKRGHEIGSHSHSHRRISELTPEEFRTDLKRSIRAIENAVEKPVECFRAPFFSIHEGTSWAFEVLVEEGIKYDSSIFPTSRHDGGSPGACADPHIIRTRAGDLYEFPISVLELGKLRLPLFGGGYFRHLPYSLVRMGFRARNRQGLPVVFYIHPHDLDHGQPRLPFRPAEAFRRYRGLKRSKQKLMKLLSEFEFTTVRASAPETIFRSSIGNRRRGGSVEGPAEIGNSGARDLREPLFKRPFDCLLAGLGLVLSLPLWLVIATLIWLEDGTPIIFRQDRIGRNGRLFSVLKFRSMIKDHGTVEVQADRDDPRITRLGRVLRKTAMDEIPQLWNIFVGDMSFVGPRAYVEKERVNVRGVEEDVSVRDVPGFELRQLVRPGLTGITQIFVRRNIPHRYKFMYDRIYVKRVVENARRPSVLRDLRMFAYDLGLILRSFWITFRGKWEV